MKVKVIIEGKEGSYSVYTDNTPCLIYGTGKSKEEALEDFKNSWEEMRCVHIIGGCPAEWLENPEFVFPEKNESRTS